MVSYYCGYKMHLTGDLTIWCRYKHDILSFCLSCTFVIMYQIPPLIFFYFLQHIIMHTKRLTRMCRQFHLYSEYILTIVEEKRTVTSPIQAYETNLDKQLRVYKLKKDTLMKATKYVKDGDKIQKLIEYWRTVAQFASNYVFNERSIAIQKMGGFQEWQRQQWEKKKQKELEEKEALWERISEELQAISNESKSAVMEQLAELGFVVSDDGEIVDNLHKESETEPEFSMEFTMKDLYRILKLDYDLVYE